MNILVTGASGFLGSQIVTDLITAGHTVTCCVRNYSHTKNLFPNTKILTCDFINDVTSNCWIERLKDIDIVINCVGILYHYNTKIMWAIHYDSLRALSDACVEVGVNKFMQISALGIDKSNVEYAKSKKAADEYLLTLPIKTIILRPSLVYGRGSYGGTSLFRGLAGLPWITPIPGKGKQEFQPIHLQDLSKSILKLIEIPVNQSIIFNAVGPHRTTLSEILLKMRMWLGFSKAKKFFIPLWLIRLVSLIGDLVPYSAINSTSYKMLIQNNITTDEETKKFHNAISFIPRDFNSGIYSQPSTVQDHWHARLYFLKPLLQISIALVWIFTAIGSLIFYSEGYSLLATIGVGSFWQPILLYGASIIDAALGIAMVCSYQLKKTAILQIILILTYSAIITWKLPYLWLAPFAPIVKNIPLLVATLVFLALESDR